MKLTIKEITEGKIEICRKILDALPDWFDLQEAKETYIQESASMPMLGCFDDKEACVGFLALKNSTPDSAEIYVMGIVPEYHHYGGGSALVLAAEEKIKRKGKDLLFVKTLSSDHPDPYYAKTRQFYAKMGFKELTVLPMIWGEENPCLIMVKSCG